jgi:HAD superfamily hydrolase (TIGR01509 family)
VASTVALVIFDCDGVLIDSEVLSADVLVAMMAEIGLPITLDIFRSDFLGRSFASAAARTEQRCGRQLPADFHDNYRGRLHAHLRDRLQPMPGVINLLDLMTTPYCLATGSSPGRLAVSLQTTGLSSYFTDRCFTASLVRHGKPAPDLYLHVADVLRVEPEQCLVIEDSEMGLRAGLAAGMAVWHFRGGSHMAGLTIADDVTPHRILDDMVELQQAFAEQGLCR